MKRVNLADAKARFNELVARAAAGEPVCIMRRGRPVAQLDAVDVPRRRVDPSALPAWPAILASFVVVGSGSRKGY
jgi:antitoxin (DNA-binding transcriptional repressor) of toxin-antitoxin stability system